MRIAGSSSLPSSSSPRGRDKEEERAVISLFFSCFFAHHRDYSSPFSPSPIISHFPNWKVGTCQHFGWWLFPVKSLPDPFPAPPNTRNRSSRLSHVTLFTHFLLLCFENRSKARGGTNRLAFREQTDRVTPVDGDRQSCRFYDKIFPI